MNDRYVMGVDGGGTKTDAVLVDEKGSIVGRARGGSSNFQAVGGETLRSEILVLFKRLCTENEIDAGDVASVVLGLAGAGRHSDREAVRALFDGSDYAGKIRVETDAVIALAGAFANQPGIILIAGTGSICFGRGADGDVVRSGGWGYLLGDEGSGYSMGRDGVIAALKDLDGRGEATSLRPALEKKFGLSAIDEIIPLIYGGRIDRSAVAGLAVSVFEEADRGDTVARSIVQETGRSLGQLVQAVAARLVLKERRIRLSPSGGLFHRKTDLYPLIRGEMGDLRDDLEFIEPEFPAPVGAALLAMESAGIRVDDDHLSRLKSTI